MKKKTRTKKHKKLKQNQKTQKKYKNKKNKKKDPVRKAELVTLVSSSFSSGPLRQTCGTLGISRVWGLWFRV